MKPYKLFAIEGIDGAGKSTTLEAMKRTICYNWPIDQKWFFTREPYNGEYIKLIKDTRDSLTKAFLFAADRAMHLSSINVYNPDIVITDRYIMSNIVYQTADFIAEKYDGANGEDYLTGLINFENIIRSIQSPFPVPDITFILMIDPNLAHTRCKSKGEYESKDRLALLSDLYLGMTEVPNMGISKKIIPIIVDVLTPEKLSSIIYDEIEKEINQNMS